MNRIRIVGRNYHKKAFDEVNENSVLTLVRETTNDHDSDAIMVLSNNNHIGYVSRKGNSKVINNKELLNKVSNVEECKVVLDKKYEKYIYAEVIEMNEYSFCIEKMTVEQIKEIAQRATLSIISDEAKWCTLAFGGMRHQFAHQEGIKPKIGEICHLERKWRGKTNGEWTNESHTEPGDKGTVHLVSNETGYSYGVLMQSEKKLNQLQRFGFKKVKRTNQRIRKNNFYLNPYTLYKVVYILEGHFIFVERVGPNEFELASGIHNYERAY